MRSRKKTEWPAYRTSGARSVRAFEDDYIRISVVGLRGVLRVQADAPAQATTGRVCEVERGQRGAIISVTRPTLVSPV